MIFEQAFLGGAPVIGFGATESEEKKFYGVMVGVPLLGLVTGAGSGGVVGYKYGKSLGAVGGSLVGGFAGGAAGVIAAKAILLASTPPTGVGTPSTATSAGLPWGEIVASSVVSAVAGLALDGIVRAARKGRR